MLSILKEALQIYRWRFTVIGAIVLTVWIPGNLAVDLLSRPMHGNENVLLHFRVASITGSLLDPLVTAALIYVTHAAKLGYRSSYRQAFLASFKFWGTLFTTRFGTWLGFLAAACC